MGVDGIGGGGRPILPGLPGLPGSAGVDLASTGSVRADATASAEGATSAEGVAGSPLLERLRTGELDLDGYLDAQVTAATAHVQSSLSSTQLDFIREALREQIAADPVLIELVRRATGAAPPTRAG
ncbi:MAG TPA: hypothetical protein VH062_35025 [Polyangiaceae bacterium]|jgi:hypothetical protein|nr:hypothetical protein [Polyangiaceae bacterium]